MLAAATKKNRRQCNALKKNFLSEKQLATRQYLLSAALV